MCAVTACMLCMWSCQCFKWTQSGIYIAPKKEYPCTRASAEVQHLAVVTTDTNEENLLWCGTRACASKQIILCPVCLGSLIMRVPTAHIASAWVLAQTTATTKNNYVVAPVTLNMAS